MPPSNVRVRAAILEVVENQLRDGTPPETKQTFERRVAAGYSDEDAKHLIGTVVAREISKVLQHRNSYDQARFVAALNQLPKTP